VSTDQQTESGLGLEAQRASITAAAARLGLALREIFTDAGISGALSIADRPALLQAVAALHRGNVLLVAKRDRLGRDVFEVAMIERLVAKHGARVVSAAGEGTDNDDPANVLLRGLVDLFAQHERLLIGVRTKQALAAKSVKGERVGNLPFGSQLGADGVHLEPAPVEQRILATIRSLRAELGSTRKIAEALNARGLTTRRGTPWRHEYVAHALRKVVG